MSPFALIVRSSPCLLPPQPVFQVKSADVPIYRTAGALSTHSYCRSSRSTSGVVRYVVGFWQCRESARLEWSPLSSPAFPFPCLPSSTGQASYTRWGIVTVRHAARRRATTTDKPLQIRGKGQRWSGERERERDPSFLDRPFVPRPPPPKSRPVRTPTTTNHPPSTALALALAFAYEYDTYAALCFCSALLLYLLYPYSTLARELSPQSTLAGGARKGSGDSYLPDLLVTYS